MAISMKTSAAIALAFATVALPATVNAATVVNASTGQGAALGGIDPNWTILSNLPAYVPLDVHNNWINGTNSNSNADGARWITPNQNGNLSVIGGTMAYSRMFTLSNIVNVSTAALSGQYWADNRVISIILNGVTIFTNPTPNGASQFAAGAHGTLVNAGVGSFVAGSNTLIFNVRNDGSTTALPTGTGNPAGFRGLLSVTAAVPEPAAWLLMLMGFGFVGFQMRRRQNTQVRFQFA